MRLIRSLASLSLLTLSLPAAAGELVPGRVPANAHWVVHLDVEGLKETQLWRALERGEFDFDMQELEEEMRKVQMEIGLNPLHDSYGATLYGSSSDPEASVLLVEATAKLDAALAAAKLDKSYRRERAAGLELHSFIEGHERHFAYVIPAGKRRLLYMSGEPELIAEAVRVQTEGAPSMARADTHLKDRPSAGAILFATCRDEIPGMEWIEEGNSRVASLIQGLTFEVGERGQAMFLHFSALTDDVEQARDLHDIVTGLRAMGRLFLSSDETVGPFADQLFGGLTIGHRGSSVSIQLELDLSAMIKRMHEVHGEGRRRHERELERDEREF